MKQYTDNELVDLYCSGQGNNFLSELLLRHKDVIYRVALRIMKNHSDTEDILQTAYIKIIRNLSLYKANIGSGNIIGWMVQIVVHTCYDKKLSEKRRIKREKKYISERISVTQSNFNELNEVVESHLNLLPEIYKAPFILQIMEGFSAKEVSDILEVPEKTIRSQIARGLEKLKSSLQRVGITASIAMVSESLKSIPQPVVPNDLKSELLIKKAIEKVSSQDFSIKKQFNNSYIFKISLLAISISVIAFGIYQWKQEALEIKNFKTISDDAVAPKLVKKWDFENNQIDFKVTKGKVFISESNGFNNTKGLEIAGDTNFEIDISKFKLPIKLSYDLDFAILSRGVKGGRLIIRKNYNADKNIFSFTHLLAMPTIKLPKGARRSSTDTKPAYFTGKFTKAEYYISEGCIDYWKDGERGDLIIGTSDSKTLYFCNVGSATIDNLIIEEISIEKIPDYKKFIDFTLTIPFEKGYKKYNFSQKEKVFLDLKSEIDLVIFDDTIVKTFFNLKDLREDSNKANSP